MLKRFAKYIYAVIVFIVLATIGIVVGVYSIVTNQIVESTTINNISEIVTHDQSSITRFIESNWDNLKSSGERLKRRADELTNVRQINEYLSYEAYESSFDKIFLLMNDGSYYTDIAYRIDESTPDFYPFKDFFNGESDKVIGYDSLPVMNFGIAIIYCYKLSDKESLSGISIGENNQEVKGIIGICRRSTIEEGLVIESYVDSKGNARGYSSLVNLKGDYIVDGNDVADFDTANFFQQIEESGRSDLSKSAVEDKMKRGETFWFYYETSGIRKLSYCSPLNGAEHVDWYFVLSVNDEALGEQTISFVWMAVVSLSIFVIVSVVAMVIVMIMQRKITRAYAHEKAQSEFLSNMSHEIRTPLNGLIGLNYLTIKAIDKPDKKKQVKEWLSKSHDTAKYLLKLINDILDISKLRAGKVDILKEPVIIETLIDSIYSMQCENIRERGIEFVVDNNIAFPCILCDDTRIKQVLMNIVGNAAKFTPAGGFIKLSVNQTPVDENHVITSFVCEDTGCGMSKEFLSKIFDKFSQERNSNSSSIKGTGLGMAISYLLIKAMGGDITVESELGKGSKFTVNIPAEISDLPDYMQFGDDRIAEDKAEDFRHIKVLIAEDNELNAEILIEILQDAGFSVERASNGEEAVNMFASSEIDEYGVILMDMRMPIFDGCEAASRIRNLDREDAGRVPILACTANTFQEDKIKAYESGMNDLLTKPIDVKILLQKMENIGNGKNSDGSEKKEP